MRNSECGMPNDTSGEEAGVHSPRDAGDEARLGGGGTAPVALITGAGRGIGRATAEAFAAEGYTVILAERLPGLGKRTEQALVGAGARALFLRTDVASQASVQQAVAVVTRRFGRLDCLVNNAGVLSVGPLVRLSVRDLEQMLAVNLRGPLLMARAALPHMLRQRSGSIINVASQLGKYGLGEYATYCATKFGVVGFTEALAAELSGTGIRVWAVCPGLTDTPMARKTGVSPRERAGLIRPETVARAIVDLATGKRREASGTAVDVTR
jgi:meso-butanediol dehydrogenase/(S,S)-butanediol dehydrogenase/diacetyl reductase